MPGNGQMRREFRRFRRTTMQMFSGLAKQLGVKEADLRKALTEIRKEQRDDFAAKLAKKLGVSEAKVKKALPDRPRALGRPRLRWTAAGARCARQPPAGAPPARRRRTARRAQPSSATRSPTPARMREGR